MRDSVSISIVAMTDNSTTTNHDVPHNATPWKKILTSLPFLGITITQCGCGFCDNISFIEMPSYINKILKYDMNANGVISSLPFVSNFTLGFIFGYCADVIIRKRIMSLENCRKMYVAISTIGPAICLVSLSFLPENSTVLSCLMLVLHQSFSAAYQGGISMSYLDISPNFCGILMSITNAVSTVCDIVVPLLVQVIVTDEVIALFTHIYKTSNKWTKLVLCSNVLTLIR
nr:unnamed protein product [Callosobruchus analis]